jgi:peptidoglycan/LPS O-acetylase OafA/YrhL
VPRLSEWFPYGYFGVDLFFVISGFLMTQMIVSDMDRARFTFAGFYWRRARRLLPASLFTLACSAMVAVCRSNSSVTGDIRCRGVWSAVIHR